MKGIDLFRYIKYFTMAQGMFFLFFCINGYAQEARPSRRQREKQQIVQERESKESLVRIDFLELLQQVPLREVYLKRNLFRPLIGPGSLRQEIERAQEEERRAREKEKGTQEDAVVAITRPETLKLSLVGTIVSDDNVAYVRAPEDDLILRMGDHVDTMIVKEIGIGQIIFLLEDGTTAILSNVEHIGGGI